MMMHDRDPEFQLDWNIFGIGACVGAVIVMLLEAAITYM